MKNNWHDDWHNHLHLHLHYVKRTCSLPLCVSLCWRYSGLTICLETVDERVRRNLTALSSMNSRRSNYNSGCSHISHWWWWWWWWWRWWWWSYQNLEDLLNTGSNALNVFTSADEFLTRSWLDSRGTFIRTEKSRQRWLTRGFSWWRFQICRHHKDNNE